MHRVIIFRLDDMPYYLLKKFINEEKLDTLGELLRYSSHRILESILPPISGLV